MPTIIGTSNSETLIGTADPDSISGLAGNDIIDGGAAADTMDGGTGDDVFVVDNSGDVVVELRGEGTDEVRSSISYALSVFVENLVLTGSAIEGVGNSLNNTITGNALDNFIKGGRGSDIFIGGAGDDSYFVGGTMFMVLDGYSFGEVDQVVELPDEGIDSVTANISYTLSANVENLRLTGDEDLSGFGNAGNNRITGNNGDNFLSGLEGDDWLDGAAGQDFLIGGAGDDTYVIDSQFDTIAPESPDVAGGIDTVRSSIGYGLDYALENLVLTGAAQIGNGNVRDNNITGNAENNVLFGDGGNDRIDGGLGNDDIDGGFGSDLLLGREGDDIIDGGGDTDRIYGDAGNDTIDGGYGADVMYGGVGNDSYVIRDGGDATIERVGEGVDSVLTHNVYTTLKANIENLTLAELGAAHGTGNGLDNEIAGNSGSNVLLGLAGNDVIAGNGGNDTIKGDTGADILTGGDGGDWLEGGAGRDESTGGAGSDRFVFRNGDFGGTTAATADVIHDFVRADGDKIRLSLVDANTTLDGHQNFAFIGTGAFTGVAGQLRYEQVDGNTSVTGDLDGDGIADFMIQVEGLHNFVVGDFILDHF